MGYGGQYVIERDQGLWEESRLSRAVLALGTDLISQPSPATCRTG